MFLTDPEDKPIAVYLNPPYRNSFPTVYCHPHLQHQSDLSDHLDNSVSYLWLSKRKSGAIQPFNQGNPVRWVKHVEFANDPHAIPKEPCAKKPST